MSRKRKIGVMTICAAVMLGSLQAGMTTVQAAPAYSGNHYGTGFDAYDEATMELSSWSNGGMFNCIWNPGNVSFSNGIMSLKIDRMKKDIQAANGVQRSISDTECIR